MRWLKLCALLLLAAPFGQAHQPAFRFLAAPYPQLGSKPSGLELLWQANTNEGDEWSVRYSFGTKAEPAETQPSIVTSGPLGGSFFMAHLNNLPVGADIRYEVVRNGAVVFRSTVRNRARPDQAFRAVIMGDVGAGTTEEGRVARLAAALRPNLLVIPGDIVYPTGRLAQYRSNFFPILNSQQAPLLRSAITVPSLGNHDVAGREAADGLAYFACFSLPRNGPNLPYHPRAVRYVAGAGFERMGSYSFTYGNSYWTVLDSNPGINWASGEPRRWLEVTLAAGKKAQWRFVVFHHPPYHSSPTHAGDLWMRRVTPLFTRYGVDVVFNGHVHNYQRSRPLQVQSNGGLRIDRAFDGKTRTRPKGTIYVVTGGGGAELYDKVVEGRPSVWKPFTSVYRARHSFTRMDVKGSRATFQQIASDGTVTDQFSIVAVGKL